MNTRLLWTILSLGLCVSVLSAQVIVGDADAGGGFKNQAMLQAQQGRPSSTTKPNVVVFVGDTVIPQIVDGGSWKTTLKFVNLENHVIVFKVLFFRDNGTDLSLPIVGVGSTINLTVTLQTANSITIETAATADVLSQGWAEVVKTTSTDSVGGFAIFRQRIPGIPDQEAVVPIVNQFSSHFVLLFDNVGFTTAVALANPTASAIVIPIAIRNEQGAIIDRQSFALGAYSHTAFALPAQWVSTVATRGTIEFITTGFGVGALGLRFNGSAFTSFDVLQNFAWIG